jgi:hypothetical protein
MGKRKTLTLLRGGSVIGTFKGDAQEDSQPRTSDRAVEYLGYFTQSYISADISLDIRAKDRVRYYIGSDYTEYLVQFVSKEAHGMGKHIECVAKVNPLSIPSLQASVQILSNIQSNYNDILRESYGNQYYTSSTITGVVKGSIDTTIDEESGGRVIRHKTDLLVEEGQVDWDTTLQINDKKYKVQDIVNTELGIDIVGLYEIKK